MASRRLKILFVTRDARYFHYYLSIIEALLKRGHEVLFLYDLRWTRFVEDTLSKLEDFKKNNPGFEYGRAKNRKDRWRDILFHTRQILGYRRFLVSKKQSAYYVNRALSYLPQSLRTFLKLRAAENALRSKLAKSVLRFAEIVIPPGQRIMNDIRGYSPDAVVASPVTMRFSSSDLEYLKAAIKMKIPSALPVISWDNLTTKDLIHVKPDVLLAWNDVHAEEAAEEHDIPREDIKIIGAPVFDRWFSGLAPKTSRTEFCERYGLNENYPIVVYLGSGPDQAEDESWLVDRLKKALNASADPKIKNTQIIIRPHPGHNDIYKNILTPDMIMLPKEGTLPNTKDSLQLFYDTLYHSEFAVMGVVNSAMIEALIVGKRGAAILTPEYKVNQQDVKHFQHIKEADAIEWIEGPENFPRAAREFFGGLDRKKEKREAFIKRFIRPLGLDKPAGDVAADEIEKL